MAFAKWYFWVHATPSGEKVSRYDTLKQVEKQTKVSPPGLCDMPELPELCRSVWYLFLNLSNVSYTEIKSYQDLTGEVLDQWEINAIMQLDKIRRANLND